MDDLLPKVSESFSDFTNLCNVAVKVESELDSSKSSRDPELDSLLNQDLLFISGEEFDGAQCKFLFFCYDAIFTHAGSLPSEVLII